jgi:D-alanyl-D-alanine carboxypeptidase (penicillin-binding protein 5/6)
MLTALVVIEQGVSLQKEVVVSAAAASVPGGKLSLFEGERFSVRELLAALLVASSNDAAVALAEEVAGTEDAFVELMNDAAGRLGATSTHVTTSHGLDSEGHVSSARDLVTIALELLATDPLAALVAMPQVTIKGSTRRAVLENTNKLLEVYPGAIGVKTGFTAGAGNVLVAAADRGGATLIAVAMRSEDAFEDVRSLLDHGFAKLRDAVVLEASSAVGGLIFDPSGATGITLEGPVPGLVDPGAALSIGFDPRHGTVPPIAEGDVVGAITVRAGGRRLPTVGAIASEAVPGATQAPWAQRFIAGLLAGGAAFLPGEIEG